MRVFVCWADPSPKMDSLFNALRKAGHDIVYRIGEREGEHRSPKEAIFHDHYDAWAGKPADALKGKFFKPLSAERLSQLHELESTILTMMNKRYDASPVEERKQIYYDMLAYWTYVLDTTKPEAVIFTTIPHSIYDYIVYTLSKERGIKTVMFEDSWVAGRLIWMTDYRKASEEFADAIERNAGREFKLEELHADVQSYFKSQTGETQIKPAYMRAQQQGGRTIAVLRHRISIAWSSLRNGTLPRLAYSYITRQFKKDLRHEYRRFVKEPDLSRRFVYFPLGFQPERTTCPQGGIYHDQILVAQTISAALPEGWELYVKEHPSQWWLRSKSKYNSARYPGYYERLAAIRGVRLVPTTFDSHKLIAHAQTVATITGTAGWETLFRLKKPLIFGYPWYLPAPQLLRVRSVEDCKKAFNVLLNSPTFPQSELLTLLKSFEEATLRGYIGEIRDHLGLVPFDVPVSREESMESIAKVVLRVLDKSK